MSYVPPQEILERYADVLINFALGGGHGVQPGEVVRIASAESAKPPVTRLLERYAERYMVLVLLAEGFRRSGEFELPVHLAVLMFGSGLVFVRALERWL